MRAVSRAEASVPDDAAAIASVNVAPNDTLAGRSTVTAASACGRTAESKSGAPATFRAIESGRNDVENQPASSVDAAVATSITPNQNAGPDRLRARRTPSGEPSAIPAMNDAAISEYAYVVGPTISASSRVHTTSYASAANPESAAATSAREYVMSGFSRTFPPSA